MAITGQYLYQVWLIDRNQHWKSIDIIDINRFNPLIDINSYQKSIEIEVTEKNNFIDYYR